MEPSTLAVLNFIVQLIVSGVIGVTLGYIFVALAITLFIAILEKVQHDGFEIIAIWLPMAIYMFMPIIWLFFTYVAWMVIF